MAAGQLAAADGDKLAAATSESGRRADRVVDLLQRRKRSLNGQQPCFQLRMLIDQLLNLLLLPGVQCPEQITEQVFL
jgi:hypothetical protein